jgi:hypothetical protein
MSSANRSLVRFLFARSGHAHTTGVRVWAGLRAAAGRHSAPMSEPVARLIDAEQVGRRRWEPAHTAAGRKVARISVLDIT